MRVLVTGGSEGIGLAIATMAAGAGAQVEIWGRDEGRLAAAQRVSGAASSQSVDVTNMDRVRAAALLLVARGPVDRVFHCAGYAKAAFIDEAGDDDAPGMFATNAVGSVNVARALAPAMMAARRGAIVLTASDLGYVGLFGWSIYAATKHAVVGLGTSLRHELAPHGVSVQVLCPPATQTAGYDRENLTKPSSVRRAEEAGGVMSAEDVARVAWMRCGRGGALIIPNLSSRVLHVLSRVSTGLVHRLVRAPGPGEPR
ncbi:MAG: SDR family NAD(P)-dependent oxidoreductase [Alphaproteobacteria bacterium]